jgi:hypothetical protein
MFLLYPALYNTIASPAEDIADSVFLIGICAADALNRLDGVEALVSSMKVLGDWCRTVGYTTL